MCTDVAFFVFLVVPLFVLGILGYVAFLDKALDKNWPFLAHFAGIIGIIWYAVGLFTVFIHFAGPEVC